MRVFRLHPVRGSTLYVRARVHPTLKAMRACPPRGPTRGAWGLCTEWLRWICDDRKCRRDPCVAEVNLAAKYLGTEVVTHEFFHATMAWARRVGFPFGRLGDDDSVNDDEERLAYIHGALCREFVDRAYAAGLYG